MGFVQPVRTRSASAYLWCYSLPSAIKGVAPYRFLAPALNSARPRLAQCGGGTPSLALIHADPPYVLGLNVVLLACTLCGLNSFIVKREVERIVVHLSAKYSPTTIFLQP